MNSKQNKSFSCSERKEVKASLKKLSVQERRLAANLLRVVCRIALCERGSLSINSSPMIKKRWLFYRVFCPVIYRTLSYQSSIFMASIWIFQTTLSLWLTFFWQPSMRLLYPNLSQTHKYILSLNSTGPFWSTDCFTAIALSLHFDFPPDPDGRSLAGHSH